MGEVRVTEEPQNAVSRKGAKARRERRNRRADCGIAGGGFAQSLERKCGIAGGGIAEFRADARRRRGGEFRWG